MTRCLIGIWSNRCCYFEPGWIIILYVFFSWTRYYEWRTLSTDPYPPLTNTGIKIPQNDNFISPGNTFQHFRKKNNFPFQLHSRLENKHWLSYDVLSQEALAFSLSDHFCPFYKEALDWRGSSRLSFHSLLIH